jgi:D-3-phosphoglycerate dehydrogenase
MFRVLVSDKLSADGISILEKADGFEVDFKPGLSPDEQGEIIGDYDGLIIRSATKVTPALLDKAAKLKIVVRAGIGVDNIDVDACTKKGVLVENTPTGNAVSAAEHAVGLLFACARLVPFAHASTHAGKWEKSKFQGVELTGKTLGVIGTGNIGGVVCNRARGLCMNVIAYDPMLSEEKAAEMGIERVELDDLLTRADAITMHVPLIPPTKHLLNAEAFAKMKDGVLLVNAARGGVVDEGAAAEALKSGKLRAAAFDVFESEPLTDDNPLRACDNVIFTPHLGASTRDAQVRVGVEAAEQVVSYLAHSDIRNALNKVG